MKVKTINGPKIIPHETEVETCEQKACTEQSKFKDIACKNCFYFKRSSTTCGECFFNPPELVLDKFSNPVFVRPTVEEDDFCSKFEPE